MHSLHLHDRDVYNIVHRDVWSAAWLRIRANTLVGVSNFVHNTLYEASIRSEQPTREAVDADVTEILLKYD